MQLLLQRTHDHPFAGTFGALYVDGAFFCYTLEDTVRELAGVPVDVWKVPGDTAIPSTAYVGRPYVVTLETSGRFGPNTMTVNDVPGYSYTRIHPGNTDADTAGCLLLGDAIDAHGIVGGTSRPAVERLQALVEQATTQQDLVQLTIVNITEPA